MKTLKMYRGLSITFKLKMKRGKNELYFVTQEDNFTERKNCLAMSSNYEKASKIFKEYVEAVL